MPASAKASRNTAVNALKRDLIREAAKRVFLARGLSAASVREIALQAGYTTGAIYFHYASKEEIYADVLRQSLSALHRDGVGRSSVAGGRTGVAHRRLPRLHRLLSRQPARPQLSASTCSRAPARAASTPSSTATSTRSFSAS